MAPPAPAMCLCKSSKEFERVLNYLKVPKENRPRWLSERAYGCVHHFENDEGEHVAVVCVTPGLDNILAVAVLVHEAVHVWQKWAEMYDEKQPGQEQEAYAIQFITTELVKEYFRGEEGGVG